MNKKQTFNVYETKCRRCGHITEWSGGEVNCPEDTRLFNLGIALQLEQPLLHRCEKCEKDTVQDIVSYGSQTY